MAVKNSLAPVQQNTALTTYKSNGEDVNLSPGIIRKYLVAGGGQVTDSEVMMFLSLCRFQHLNPFLREAYLIKYGNEAATMVVGKDVFVKRAMKDPDFKGPRLKQYDYSTAGAYFITICTHNRRCLLSRIVGRGLAPAEIQHTVYGQIAREQLLLLEKQDQEKVQLLT